MPAVRVQALVAVPAELVPVVVPQVAAQVPAVVLRAARPAVVLPQVVAQQLVPVARLPVVLPQLVVPRQLAQVPQQRRVQQLLQQQLRLVWWLPVWRLRQLLLRQQPRRTMRLKQPLPIPIPRQALSNSTRLLLKAPPWGAFLLFCSPAFFVCKY